MKLDNPDNIWWILYNNSFVMWSNTTKKDHIITKKKNIKTNVFWYYDENWIVTPFALLIDFLITTLLSYKRSCSDTEWKKKQIEMTKWNFYKFDIIIMFFSYFFLFTLNIEIEKALLVYYLIINPSYVRIESLKIEI